MRYFKVLLCAAVVLLLVSCFPKKTYPDKYPKISWLPGFTCTNKNIYFHTVIDSTEHFVNYYNQLDKVNLMFVLKRVNDGNNVYLRIVDKKFNFLEEKKLGYYDGSTPGILANKAIFYEPYIIDCDDFSIREPEAFIMDDSATNDNSILFDEFKNKLYPKILAVYDLDLWADSEFLIVEKNREYKLLLEDDQFNKSPQKSVIDSLLEKKEKSPKYDGTLFDSDRTESNLEIFDQISYESKFEGAGGSCVVLPVWSYSNRDLIYYKYYYNADTLFFKAMEGLRSVTEIENNHLVINYRNGNTGLVQVRQKKN